MRKNVVAIAAVIALGTAAIASSASAQQQRGGGAPMGGGGGAPHASAPMGGGGGAPHASFGGGGGVPQANFGAAPRGNFGATTAPNRFARTAPGNVAAPRTNFANGGLDRDHRHGRRFGPGFGVGVFAFGGPDYYYDDDTYADDSCWQRRWVQTEFGWRWRLVDVCE